MLYTDKKKIFNGEFYLFLYTSILIFIIIFLDLEMNYCFGLTIISEGSLLLFFYIIYKETKKTYLKYENVKRKRLFFLPYFFLILLTYLLLVVFKILGISRFYLLILILVNFIVYLIKLFLYVSGFIVSKKEIKKEMEYTFFLKYLIVKKEKKRSSFFGVVLLSFYFEIILSFLILTIIMMLNFKSFNLFFNYLIYFIYLLLFIIFFTYIYKNNKDKRLIYLLIYEVVFLLVISIYLYLFSLKGTSFYDLDFSEFKGFLISCLVYFFLNFLAGVLLIVKKRDLEIP